MKPLIQPQVNLNGTSRAELFRQLDRVADSLRGAVARMCEARPHARDFQMRESREQFEAARTAWEERIAAAQLMLEEIEQHAAEIQAGGLR